MVKRILSTLIIIGATSLVALCLHQKNEQPYEMYSQARHENEIYYNTVDVELNEVVHSSELSLQENSEIVRTDYRNGEMALAGVSIVLSKADLKEDNRKKKYLYDVTEEEIKMLQRITEAEATGKDIESKKNVVSTILNRVGFKSFPDDIKSVIFQDGQFTPTEDGRYESVKITEDTIQAVDEVLTEGIIHDCLYFFSLKDVKSTKTKSWIGRKLEFVFKDSAGHSYYVEK